MNFDWSSNRKVCAHRDIQLSVLCCASIEVNETRLSLEPSQNIKKFVVLFAFNRVLRNAWLTIFTLAAVSLSSVNATIKKKTENLPWKHKKLPNHDRDRVTRACDSLQFRLTKLFASTICVISNNKNEKLDKITLLIEIGFLSFSQNSYQVAAESGLWFVCRKTTTSNHVLNLLFFVDFVIKSFKFWLPPQYISIVLWRGESARDVNTNFSTL